MHRHASHPHPLSQAQPVQARPSQAQPAQAQPVQARTGGVEAQAALVGADGGRVLHAEAAVDLQTVK